MTEILLMKRIEVEGGEVNSIKSSSRWSLQMLILVYTLSHQPKTGPF